MRPKCIPAAGWKGILIALSLLVGCSSRTAPEQMLRESMAQLQTSLENRDAAGVSEWLADDFVGPEGMDRDGAGRLARVMFLRHRDVGVTLGPFDVALQHDHATVRFTAVLTGSSNRMLPEAARVYEVESGWRMDDDGWRLTSVRWSPRL